MESKYLEAVCSGDIHSVDQIVSANVTLGLDINATDAYGRSPLNIAIEDGNIEMLKLLLKYKVDFGDALLHAVNIDYVEGVRILCEAFVIAKEFGVDHINKFACECNFKKSTTPLMLAGKRNNPVIIQILLQHGAKMPNLKELASHCSDSFSLSLAHKSWYEAITSDVYLICASDDPLRDAFKLAHQIARVASRSPQMKVHYDQMYEKLVVFVTQILDLTRSKSEIRAVMGDDNIRTDQDSLVSACKLHVPERLKSALALNFKQFVAHPTLQESLLSDWYRGWQNWNNLSSTKFALLSLLIVVCFPVLSVMYCFISHTTFITFMEAPYVRFLMNTASRIFFLGILVCTTITTTVFFDSSVSPMSYDSELLQFLAYKGPPPNVLILVVYVWIAGFVWYQLRQVWRQGLFSFWKNRWNLVDSVQLLFYIVYVVMNTIALVQALEISTEYIAMPDKSATSNRASNTSTGCGNVAVTMITPAGPTATPKIDTGSGPGLNQVITASYKDEDRLSWDGWDPLLLAEASFAIANVLSFLGLMHNMVILGFVGPLQISLGGMLLDIFKFLLLFTLVWVSFAIGFTQLYRTFEVLEVDQCCQNPDLECDPPSFDTFTQSLETLFWSVFGVIRLNSIRIAPDNPNVSHQLYMTEAVGFAMYTIYLVVAVIVLLNALIAMMSTTYAVIEENAVNEWMVARTSLMTQFMCDSVGILPPPFNLIPSVNDITALCRKLRLFCDTPNTGTPKEEEVEKEKTNEETYESIIRMLTLRYIRTKQAENARKKQSDTITEELKNLKSTVGKSSKT